MWHVNLSNIIQTMKQVYQYKHLQKCLKNYWAF